ncbi:caldesmon-like isoform X2 [Salvia hispanica]|nr:caldesmon-like isoform X2 [Salvia hispanica]
MGGSGMDMGENKTFADNRLNRSKIVDADDGKSKSKNDGFIDRRCMLGRDGKIGKTEEDSESSDGSDGEDPSLMMNGENGNGTVEGKQIQEEKREVSVEKKNIQEEEREASVEKENIQEEEREASVEKENIQEEDREASVEKENIQEEEREASVEEESIQVMDCGTSSASTNRDSSLNGGARAKRGSKRSKPIDKEPETVSAQSKYHKHHDKKKQASTTSTPTKRSTRISSSAMGTGKVVREEFASPRSLRKHEKPSEKSDTFSSGKRRKVVWMEEEDEALKEGAKKYMDEEKIPWKKILEESSKFDPTRTPNDLKNRWRNGKFA